MTKFDRLKDIGDNIAAVLLIIAIIGTVLYTCVILSCVLYWLSVFVKFTIYTAFGWDIILPWQNLS